MLPAILLSGLLLQAINLTDESVNWVSNAVWGPNVRLAKMYRTAPPLTPFTVNAPATTPGLAVQYCIGFQEFYPAMISTPFGPRITGLAGQPLPNISWKICAASWDLAFSGMAAIPNIAMSPPVNPFQ